MGLFSKMTRGMYDKKTDVDTLRNSLISGLDTCIDARLTCPIDVFSSSYEMGIARLEIFLKGELGQIYAKFRDNSSTPEKYSELTRKLAYGSKFTITGVYYTALNEFFINTIEEKASEPIFLKFNKN
jgi:hypothetical protein